MRRWPYPASRHILSAMGLVGERKATAAAILCFYALFFLLNAIAIPDESLVAYMASLAALYGVGFFALVAGYFWARWFAIGLGLYGFIVGSLVIWQIGAEPVVVFYAATHGLIALFLWGRRVAEHFDGRKDWRARFHLDDNATNRLGKAVIRASISLPFLLAYALVPRSEMMTWAVAFAVSAWAGLGLLGLLRMRTWGVLTIMTAALAMLAAVAQATLPEAQTAMANFHDVSAAGTGLIAAVLLLTATLPFIGPMVRHLRGQ